MLSKAIIAIAKDENRYLDEWITYYHNLGFSHIYIGDNNDVDDLSIYEVTNKYDYVTIIDVRGRDSLNAIGMQEGFYRKLYNDIKSEYDWIGIFDIDEFLWLPKSLDDFLKEKQWEDTAVIRFNWMYYGDNGLINYDSRSVQERFKEPCIYGNDGTKISGTKYLVRGKTDNITLWVHSAYHPTLKCRHANGVEEDGQYGGSDIIDFTNGYVKHYGTKTLEEYLKNKCCTIETVAEINVNLSERLNWFFNVNKHTLEKDAMVNNFVKNIKLNTAVIAIAKNENQYLDEWVTYYHNLGFSHIYIWDNNDIDDNSIYEITDKYNYVTVLDVRGREKLISYGMQSGCYQRLYNDIKDQYDWIGFFDIDEFLYLTKPLDDFLKEEQWYDTGVIRFNWRYYGDNDLVHYDNRPVQERFTKPCPDDVIFNPNIPGENYIVKSLVRGKINGMTITVHSAYHSKLKCKHANGEIQDGTKHYALFIDFSNGYVKHYGTKTIEEYLDRRCTTREKVGNFDTISASSKIDRFFNINKHTSEKDALVNEFWKNYNINNFKEDIPMKKYRLHVLGVPHTRTTTAHATCSITQKVRLFCKMMHARGHIIYHYGTEGSNPDCTENITVVSDETWQRVYGHVDIRSDMPFNEQDDVYKEFRARAIEEIGKRKQPGDIILPFWGCDHKEICEAHPDIITIEPGIGYLGSFADIRAYESYGWMNCQLGDQEYPKWYHTVIPPFFDINDFNPSVPHEERMKDPYFVYLGRITQLKGVTVAMEACQALGAKLIVAGHPHEEFENYNWPENVKFIGAVGIEERKHLLENAIGTYMPSLYSEPFGYVQVESMLSGTPVITPDWGSFPETNINGLTGYRCRTFADFVNAGRNCLEGKIDRMACRKWGERYSFDSIAPKYEKFFQDVSNLYNGTGGWYALRPETEDRIAKLKNTGIHSDKGILIQTDM